MAGRVCESPHDSVAQQLMARLLRPGDVVVAISDSGMNSVTLHAVEAAIAADVPVVGLTSYSRSRLSDLATYSLVAGVVLQSWGSNPFASAMAQVLALAALSDSVFRVRGADDEVTTALIDEVTQIVHDSNGR
jgi:DNA-binding MurR/RpiR family transcriptional regulator